MANLDIKNVKISFVAAAVPGKVVRNADYDWITPDERKQVVEVTGVEERRFAPRGVCTSDMAVELANRFFLSSNWKRSDIDLLIFVSQSRDYVLPNTACILQDRLGLNRQCIAFDIPLGCSGFVYGLSVISSMLEAGKGMLKKALLIAGDVSSYDLNYRDKSSYPLFGDAVSLTALEYSPDNEGKMMFSLWTDGKGFDALYIPDGGTRNNFNDDTFIDVEISEGIWRNRKNVVIDGGRIFQFTMLEVAKNIREVLALSGTPADAVDMFFLHQANKLMNETVRKQLKQPAEKFPLSIGRYGNTSSASVPLTMVSSSQPLSGKKIILSGFGVGLSWASAFITQPELVVLPLLELNFENDTTGS